MTYRNILAAMGAAFALWIASPDASAQINLPDAPGFIDRAAAMATDDNARGTIDQSLRALALYPSASQAEDAAYLKAIAALRERDASAPRCSKHMPPTIPRARGPRGPAWLWATGILPPATMPPP